METSAEALEARAGTTSSRVATVGMLLSAHGEWEGWACSPPPLLGMPGAVRAVGAAAPPSVPPSLPCPLSPAAGPYPRPPHRQVRLSLSHGHQFSLIFDVLHQQCFTFESSTLMGAKPYHAHHDRAVCVACVPGMGSTPPRPLLSSLHLNILIFLLFFFFF